MITKKIVIYVAVPVGVSLVLIAAYFSGVDWLQQIVSPRMPRMHPNAGREFGLLENLQNMCLLVMVGTAAWGVKRKALKAEKAALALITVFAPFVLLRSSITACTTTSSSGACPWRRRPASETSTISMTPLTS